MFPKLFTICNPLTNTLLTKTYNVFGHCHLDRYSPPRKTRFDKGADGKICLNQSSLQSIKCLITSKLNIL